MGTIPFVSTADQPEYEKENQMPESNELSRMGVALIGAGMIAKTHVEALSAARARVRLAVIVSRRPERAAAMHWDNSRDGIPVFIES